MLTCQVSVCNDDFIHIECAWLLGQREEVNLMNQTRGVCRRQLERGGAEHTSPPEVNASELPPENHGQSGTGSLMLGKQSILPFSEEAPRTTHSPHPNCPLSPGPHRLGWASGRARESRIRSQTFAPALSSSNRESPFAVCLGQVPVLDSNSREAAGLSQAPVGLKSFLNPRGRRARSTERKNQGNLGLIAQCLLIC